MNILLVGEIYSTNLGDPLLCNTVYRIISNEFANAKITKFDISGKISFSENFQYCFDNLKSKIISKTMDTFHNILKKIPVCKMFFDDESRYCSCIGHFESLIKSNHFDLILFAGGQMFIDYFVLPIYYIVKKAEKKNIKVIFHACGGGDLSNKSMKLLRKTLNRKQVVSISLRDSFDKIRELLIDKTKVIETYDTALCCSSFYTEIHHKKFDYGIGIISNEKYYEEQKQMVKLFLDSNLSWALFTNGAPYDQKFAVRILDDLNVSKTVQKKYLLNRPANEKQLIHNITSFRFILTYRLHSIIVASSFKIPSYGFVWDLKVKRFYDKIGLSNNYSYPQMNKHNIEFFDEFRTLSDNAFDNIVKAANDSKELLILKIKEFEEGVVVDS